MASRSICQQLMRIPPRPLTTFRPGQQQRWMSLEALNASKHDRERVLILGSGWGGFGVARSLDTSLYQPIIVTPRTYFVFTPLLAGTAVGTLEFRTAMESAHNIKGVDVIRGRGENIDFANKQLHIESQDGSLVMDYDKLIISVGAYAQTFGVPGVKEHAFFLKDVADARRIRDRILERFEEAALPMLNDAKRKELLHFVVVGGGPTGVEFAAELHDLLEDDLKHTYPDLVNLAKITVYDVAPNILAMFDKKLQGYATQLFDRQHIEVATSHHVLEVQPDAIVTKEEGRVPCGAIIWSTGLVPNTFVANTIAKPFKTLGTDKEMKIVKAPRGMIQVDSRLRVLVEPKEGGEAKPLKDVFALGDCASIKDQMLPATAQVANQQAKWLGKALNKSGKKMAEVTEEAEFQFRSLGIMAYLGSWNAVMQKDKLDVKGKLSWLLWRTAYLTKSVSWRNRGLITVYWFLNWVFGRDINRF
ncbi:pyridine nucleotide-disulfide oxidoreductase-domain-containing protein [Pyronema omphalodes]|nr:pyridine nucleotide-disulfide oxidoreductase-domain-containing protein [Pyronema omphalodes]